MQSASDVDSQKGDAADQNVNGESAQADAYAYAETYLPPVPMDVGEWHAMRLLQGDPVFGRDFGWKGQPSDRAEDEITITAE